MNAVLKEPEVRRGDYQGPCVIRVISGKLVDLNHPDPDTIDINDIAWSLSKQIRYNGHIPYDYTVARHSIIMSYFVSPECAMEALLHDAGEAYCGDIIYPIKISHPELEDFEDRVTAVIMQKYNNGKNVFHVDKDGDDSKFEGQTLKKKVAQYKKSEEIARADILIARHECSRFGRPGEYIPMMMMAECNAIYECGLKPLETTGMKGDRLAFLRRFDMLYTSANA